MKLNEALRKTHTRFLNKSLDREREKERESEGDELLHVWAVSRPCVVKWHVLVIHLSKG